MTLALADFATGWINFNSHAHVERDEIVIMAVAIGSISTHTLTWSVTLSASSKLPSSMNFNSHAHVERDLSNLQKQQKKTISTHTLTWSVTYRAKNASISYSISTHTLTWSVTKHKGAKT